MGPNARAEARLGRLPDELASFLRSFDGADLFHEAIVVGGVGDAAPRSLVALNEGGDAPTARGELVFAEAVAGDRFALDARGRVLRLRAGSDERIVAGSAFERWLDATVARERVLYGPDGEFATDVFDEDGEEIAAAVVLRQTERALKVDPGSAEAQHERGLALRRLGRLDRALEAFSAASELDPDDPWPWFDFGRTALSAGRELPRARDAFARAAAREEGPSGARLYAWAARAAVLEGDEAAAAEMRREALARDPALLDGLARAEAEAVHESDEEARAENEALRLAIAPTSTARRSLPVIQSSVQTSVQEQGGVASPRRPPPRPGGPVGGPAPPRPLPPPRPDRPPRPAPAKPRRGGGSRKAARPRK
jgi:tetratricopeptide (TPR) repeat protein